MSKKCPALLEQLLEGVGLAADLNEGVALAADTIDSGKAAKFLGNFRAHFAV